MVYALKSIFLFNYPIWVCILAPFVQMSEGVFIMPRLSKKAKQEWKFFITPNTGRRTYNKLCRKCYSDCKQSYRVIIVYCRKFKAKRSVITKDDK